MKLADIHKVHFIGIGGIGMSALARFMYLRGKEVSGYDRTATPLTNALVDEGMTVRFTAAPDQLAGTDLVVYTPAVSGDHAEFAAAEKLGIPILKRSEVLGLISQAYRTIAIAGTHGKTTTTALTAHLLRACGVDATAFIGGISRNFNSNFVNGTSEWVVIEADEFDRSFLTLKPDVAVITSMDADHLDIYGDEDSLKTSFKDFANQILPGGTLYICDRTERLDPEAIHVDGYGIEGAEIQGTEVDYREDGVYFNYRSPQHSIDNLVLHFPGRYNLENALAAISVAKLVGVEDDDLRKALGTAAGVHRRYEQRLKTDRLAVIDDYAHHPEEIRAVLSAVRTQYGDRKLIVIFQPHLFSRTNDFHEEFAEALSMADVVILLDIFPAREEPIEGVSSELIYENLDVAEMAWCGLESLIPTLEGFQSESATVMVVGAGDISTKVEAVVHEVNTW